MSKLKEKMHSVKKEGGESSIYTILGVGLILACVFLVYFVFFQPQPQIDFAVLEADGHSKGSDSPKVRVVEFSDFQCPSCAKVSPVLDDLITKYPGKIKLTYRHMPLSEIHENAQKAAEASECAGEQGKFWEMHDIMFKNQESLDVDSLVSFSKGLGLDSEKFSSCLASGKMAQKVSADNAYARSLGLNSTPTIFIDGRKANFSSFDELAQQIKSKIA